MGFILDTSNPTTPRPGIICDNGDCVNVVREEGWVLSVGLFPTHVACCEGCIPAIVAQFGEEYGAPRRALWNKPVRVSDYLTLLATPREHSFRL